MIVRSIHLVVGGIVVELKRSFDYSAHTYIKLTQNEVKATPGDHELHIERTSMVEAFEEAVLAAHTASSIIERIRNMNPGALISSDDYDGLTQLIEIWNTGKLHSF